MEPGRGRAVVDPLVGVAVRLVDKVRIDCLDGVPEDEARGDDHSRDQEAEDEQHGPGPTPPNVAHRDPQREAIGGGERDRPEGDRPDDGDQEEGGGIGHPGSSGQEAAVVHAKDAVALPGDLGIVGDHHERLLVSVVERAQ